MPTGKEEVVNILMARDGLPRHEAEEWLQEVMIEVETAVARGEDPEEIWMDELSLEPDYLFNILMEQ